MNDTLVKQSLSIDPDDRARKAMLKSLQGVDHPTKAYEKSRETIPWPTKANEPAHGTLFKHFKGDCRHCGHEGTYEYLYKALDTTISSEVVVYRNVQTQEIFTRPWVDFFGVVNEPRFKELD